VLEVAAAGLAAERAAPLAVASIAEEVASLFAALHDPQRYLVHDVQFHRAVAMAAGNRVIETLVGTVAELVYEDRQSSVHRARDLHESAELHRRIYLAIKAHDPEAARRQMAEHLHRARQALKREERLGAADPGTVKPRPARRRSATG
jgi:GntR family transcriptional repressor for pyruvate dehydrogenase complex